MGSQAADDHSNGVSSRHYIRWDSEGVQSIPSNEAEDIKAVAEMINSIQRTQFNKARHCFSGTHARTQGVVKGKLIVGDLSSHLAQTLFSHPGEYPICMRYSTEPGDPGLDDRIPQPRGLGIKVFKVDGEMFEAGKDFPTHDIEFNSTPALDLADAKTTREIVDLRIKYGKARDEVHNTHLTSIRYYSQTAYRYGDFIVKYSLVPSSEVQKKQYQEAVKPDSHPDNILSSWVKEFYANNEAEYLFQVQLCENLEDQPVEYAGKTWDDEKYPWQTVAKIVVPKQDSMIPARKTFWEDHIRLDPFQGLKSFEPIGSPNRLRRVVYPASAALRHELNGRKEVNMTSIDQLPDGGYVEC
ncbi:Heme-dependent catalase-like protein [Glarea lozoyensis ATCC 20868]|uniref:Heme-dependent catalase-like protein n=1 Tax=Glarea lozoyensis (strain ATCC 20868 / MF5171) TaxID=1116229 RepID=S3DY48_GLAL2|nr:Heme-dependent catalase-like protein [Glarea lozoyensis ATCC 20868]EPE36826.1 Heme-dependent catalase-like protein [Glarea lozoyensis ATCC 20868]